MILADDNHATAICLVSIYVHSHNIPADHRTRGWCEGKRTFERHRHQTTHANSSPKIVVISIIGNNNGTTTSRKNKRPKKSKKPPGKLPFLFLFMCFRRNHSCRACPQIQRVVCCHARKKIKHRKTN